MPQATKVSSVVTYGEGLQNIKPDDDLIKWLCEVT